MLYSGPWDIYQSRKWEKEQHSKLYLVSLSLQELSPREPFVEQVVHGGKGSPGSHGKTGSSGRQGGACSPGDHGGTGGPGGHGEPTSVTLASELGPVPTAGDI